MGRLVKGAALRLEAIFARPVRQKRAKGRKKAGEAVGMGIFLSISGRGQRAEGQSKFLQFDIHSRHKSMLEIRKGHELYNELNNAENKSQFAILWGF